jgi:hypothetical protein
VGAVRLGGVGPAAQPAGVLPILLLSLATYGSRLRPFAVRVLEHASTVPLVALAILLVAAPHVGYLWRYSTVPEFFSRRTAHCPAFGPGAQHYECLSEQMWSRRPISIDALAGLTSGTAVLTLVAVALVVIGSLVLFRRELRVETSSPAASSATML